MKIHRKVDSLTWNDRSVSLYPHFAVVEHRLRLSGRTYDNYLSATERDCAVWFQHAFIINISSMPMAKKCYHKLTECHKHFSFFGCYLQYTQNILRHFVLSHIAISPTHCFHKIQHFWVKAKLITITNIARILISYLLLLLFFRKK